MKEVSMHEPESPSIQAYERPVTRLQALEHEVFTAFMSLLQASDPDVRPRMRQLAFLEGLRRQRDDAREVLRKVEADLFARIASQLGIPGPGTDRTE
jgi:hypothetical protein